MVVSDIVITPPSTRKASKQVNAKANTGELAVHFTKKKKKKKNYSTLLPSDEFPTGLFSNNFDIDRMREQEQEAIFQSWLGVQIQQPTVYNKLQAVKSKNREYTENTQR